MKVFIFHCWGGNSRDCWRGWLADTLRAKGIEVVAPDFPSTDNPKLEEWLAAVRQNVPKFDPADGWIFVAHSLGCPTVLRLLETFGPDEKVSAAILVAAFAKDVGIFQIKNFVSRPFKWKKIKAGCGRFIVINSDNDPYIPLAEGDRMAEQLGAELIMEHGAGHLNAGSGFATYGRLPEIIEKLR